MNIATYDLPDLYRGDTLDPVYLKLKFKNPPLVPLDPSTPPDATVDPDGTIHPAKVCCQLRDRAGRLLHTFNTQVHAEGTVELGGVASDITALWEPGVYLYDVEFTLPKGRVRTYLKGQIKILGDVSSCQIP